MYWLLGSVAFALATLWAAANPDKLPKWLLNE